MRPILVLAAALTLVAHSVAAAEWRLGLQAGGNSSGLSGDAPAGVSIGKRSGLAAGLLGEVRLSEDTWLSVQPMYLQRGTTTKIAVSGQEEKLEGPTLSLDYLAIPILVRITSVSGRTYVTGGMNPAFLLEAQLQDGTTTADVASAMSDFALAADIGFGVMLPMRRAMLTLELRYEQSILNVASSDRQDSGDGLPVRFRSTGFQFLAGLVWPLGGK